MPSKKKVQNTLEEYEWQDVNTVSAGGAQYFNDEAQCSGSDDRRHHLSNLSSRATMKAIAHPTYPMILKAIAMTTTR